MNTVWRGRPWDVLAYIEDHLDDREIYDLPFLLDERSDGRFNFAYLRLPTDLSTAEAERLGRVVKTLVVA